MWPPCFSASSSQFAPGAHYQVGQVPARLQVLAQEHAQRQGLVVQQHSSSSTAGETR